jgi:glutaredoxin
MIDASDLGAPLPFELDHLPTSSVPPAPGPSAYAPPQQRYVRRCHRDGLELDAFGDCARCQHERAEAQLRADKRGKLAVLAVIAMVVGAIVLGFAWSAKSSSEGRSAAATISARNGNQLVVYTSNGCGACAYAKKYMDEHGIPYVERRIDSDTSAYAELASLNGPIVVPTFVAGDEVMSGMDPTGATLERALTKHGIRKSLPADAQAAR